MNAKLPCAVLGSGNIGTDLMFKLGRSTALDLRLVVGVDPASEGLARAREAGVAASAEGVDAIINGDHEVSLVFDATSASAHTAHAPLLHEAGMRLVDLTPAKLGPGVVPVVNLMDHQDAPDVNMVTCGGQATIPLVAAVSRVCAVPYAEVVATIASRSAGPGTRQSIDEFTQTTARGVERIGGAEQGKAIIILNPAEPPLTMRNTVLCNIGADVERPAIEASVEEMCARVSTYVPGYRLSTAPVFDEERVELTVEVTGAGDYLPTYAGNLDIMTCAAVRVGEELARRGAERAVAT